MHIRHLLIANNNANLLKDDYSNSASQRFKGIKIRDNKKIFINNVSEYKGCTVSTDDIDYISYWH